MPNTREKLIELLYNLPTPEPVIGIRAGKQLMTAGFIADHLIANGVTVQQWISVKDRLPETSALCIALKYNVPFLAWYMGNGWRSASAMSVVDGITHWMPLPEPPKGE